MTSSKPKLSRSNSMPQRDVHDDPEQTPTAEPAAKGERWGRMLRRSVSLFEHSPFFSVSPDSGDEENQRAMRIAFYNTATFVFVGVMFYTCTQVFYILEFCIRPLLWALILGAVLYPVKQLGKQVVLTGLDSLADSGAPPILVLVVLPFIAIQRTLIWAANITRRTYKEMIISLIILLLILLTDMVDIIDMANDVISYISTLSNLALVTLEHGRYIVWTMAVAYLLFVCIWWEPNTMPYIEWLGIPLWVLSLATGISYLGQWRNLIAISVFAILGCGAYVKYSMKSSSDSPRPKEPERQGVTFLDAMPMSSTPISTPHHATRYATPATSTKSRYATPGTNMKRSSKQALKFLDTTNKVSTEKYFSVLGWSVVFTLIGRDIFFVFRLSSLILILFLLYQLYRFLHNTTTLHVALGKVKDFAGRGRKFKALCPPSIRGLGILLIKGQDLVLHVLRIGTNQVVSATIVVVMILSLCLITFFILYTVHSEILYILQASSGYINSHIQSSSEHLPSLNSSLSAWAMGLTSAHTAGRGWIKTKISMLPEGDSTKDLEHTLLSLYDSMYEQWINRNISSSRSNVTLNHLLSTVKGNMVSLDVLSINAAKSNLAHLLTGQCTKTPDKGTLIANYILCSKGMIGDVLNSLWTIFSSNMTLVLQLTFSFMSGIVEGGAAFLNFVVQFVVFITALYYLLIYSDKYYAPVEFMTSLLPSSVDRVESTSAFFDATRGIFGASLKLSVFYGCYVWASHTLFGLEMVFVPALVAAMLSVVPVVGVYWASVPGCLVLWLVDGRTLRAAAFMILQILPTYFIDMAVYSEIEGGWHPYITGLAVVGGIYYFGLEGAFIGPLVISILKFTINLYECVYDNLTPSNSNKTIADDDD